ncbi:MAG: hypothetical protein AAGF47_09875 [Planctomycetota bacterium]
MLYGTKAVLLAASMGVIGVASANSQVSAWANASGGSWNDGLNWDTGIVPTLPGQSAVIGINGMYEVTYTGVASAIGALDLTNPDATLSILPGGTLGLSANSVNNGLIRLNPSASSFNSVLAIGAPMTLSGSGELRMQTSFDNSQIAGVGLLTNAAGHTIRGVGQIFAPLSNGGRVAADIGVSVSGNNLELRSAIGNSGRLAAAASSLLEIESGTLVTQPSGEIVAENGGTVSLLGGSGVIGGEIASEGTGFVQTITGSVGMESITNTGDLRFQPGSTVDVTGTGLVNTGQIDMNPAASSSNSVMNFVQSGAIEGTGTIRMRTSFDNTQIIAEPGQSVLHAATHTIRGVGRIDAPVINNGTISADVGVSVSGNNLELRIEDKVNNGLISSEGSSFLDIEAIAIDQSGGGEIRAEDGGVVGFFGVSSVTDGELNAIGAGFYDVESGADTTLSNVTLSGNGRISPNGEVILAGSGITNNGLLEINRDASSSNGLLTALSPVTIDGAGEIRMRTAFDNSQINTGGAGVITHGADHLIRGVGQINAALINDGIISADVSVSVSGAELTLRTENKINNNTMTAEAGTRLDIDAITVTQGPAGMILASDGQVNLGTGTRIENGMLASTGTGFVSNDAGIQELSGIDFTGDMRLSPGSTVTVDASGLTNDGLIQLNPNASSSNAVLELDDASIDGTGEIQMRTAFDNSEIRSAAATIGVLGAGQLVRGVGRFRGELVNNGEIRADVSVSVSGTSLEVGTDSMINNGLLAGRPGSTLILDNVVDQSGGGETLAEGGIVSLADGNVLIGGTLDASGDLVGAQPSWTTIGVSSIEGTVVSGNGFVNAGDTLATGSVQNLRSSRFTGSGAVLV